MQGNYDAMLSEQPSDLIADLSPADAFLSSFRRM